MQIEPSEDWCWYICEQRQKLMLELGDEMLFVSHYTSKQIPEYLDHKFQFTTFDRDLYYLLYDRLCTCGLPAAQVVYITLNAIAAARYCLPRMPQSWYFKSQDYQQPEIGDLVIMEPENKYVRSAHFLVIEVGLTACTCILLDEALELDERKHMVQFDMIKVMNDRIRFPNLKSQQVRWAG